MSNSETITSVDEPTEFELAWQSLMSQTCVKCGHSLGVHLETNLCTERKCVYCEFDPVTGRGPECGCTILNASTHKVQSPNSGSDL